MILPCCTIIVASCRQTIDLFNRQTRCWNCGSRRRSCFLTSQRVWQNRFKQKLPIHSSLWGNGTPGAISQVNWMMLRLCLSCRLDIRVLTWKGKAEEAERFKHLLKELGQDVSWRPVNCTTASRQKFSWFVSGCAGHCYSLSLLDGKKCLPLWDLLRFL